MTKPFSEACERNKEPIFSHLSEIITAPSRVLEIGSGTGQHAVYFASQLPFVIWQTSDLVENHFAIEQWIAFSGLSNVLPPLELDVSADFALLTDFDFIFTANTLHIMSWEKVICFFQGIGKILKIGGRLIIYGPFNYYGNYTSQSNADFDAHLKYYNPLSGIRDFEAILKLAKENNLFLENDFALPANNRLLVFSYSVKVSEPSPSSFSG